MVVILQNCNTSLSLYVIYIYILVDMVAITPTSYCYCYFGQFPKLAAGTAILGNVGEWALGQLARSYIEIIEHHLKIHGFHWEIETYIHMYLSYLILSYLIISYLILSIYLSIYLSRLIYGTPGISLKDDRYDLLS